MGDNVLVTGGAGFLGGQVALDLVQKGNNVIIFDLFYPGEGSEINYLLKKVKDEGNFKFIKGNITDYSSVFRVVKLNKINKIVHTAVMNDLEILKESPLQTAKVNFEGTLNVLEAARIFDVEKVIFASSIAVYAPKQYEPIDERHPVILPNEGPTLLSYSPSKLSAEAFGLHYCTSYGLDFVALRFSAVYGLGMKHPMFVKPIVENIANKIETHFKGGKESKRDYTYIKDVISSIDLALNTETNSKIFNISTGEELKSPLEVSEVVSKFEPSVNITFGDVEDPIERRSVQTRGRLSIELAKEELGYRPQYSLADGLEDYFYHYKKYSGEQV